MPKPEAEPLPPFNPKQICPKCGAWRDTPAELAMEHVTTYHESAYGCTEPCEECGGKVQFRNSFEGEHLHRRCGRCGFDWAEGVI